MHLIYIDEVKFLPPDQDRYWLCALAIPGDTIKSVESALADIAQEYFGTSLLEPTTEFHAKEIIHGKGPYKGKDIGERLELLKRLANVVRDHPAIGRIQVCLDPARISRDDYQHIAFMYMVERADQLMDARGSLGLLISDYDREFVTDNVRSLSAFKIAGTEFAYGQEITRMIDTVHHTQSHHSRLLQLADIYTYSVCLAHNKPDRYPKNDYVHHIRGLDPFLFPDKYKHWPADA